MVRKYDCNDKYIFVSTINSDSIEKAQDLTLDDKGNIYILGSGFFNSKIHKLDANGNELWKKVYSSDLNTLQLDTTGYLYAVGSQTVNNRVEFLQIVLNSHGNEISSKTWNPKDISYITCTSLAIDNDGNRYYLCTVMKDDVDYNLFLMKNIGNDFYRNLFISLISFFGGTSLLYVLNRYLFSKKIIKWERELSVPLIKRKLRNKIISNYSSEVRRLLFDTFSSNFSSLRSKRRIGLIGAFFVTFIIGFLFFITGSMYLIYSWIFVLLSFLLFFFTMIGSLYLSHKSLQIHFLFISVNNIYFITHSLNNNEHSLFSLDKFLSVSFSRERFGGKITFIFQSEPMKLSFLMVPAPSLRYKRK